ncbi:MAG: hypothetical protein JHC21_03645 [Thermocrinis sp.]|nr:hypothetical protein [Thermocrinis sp.]
MFRPFLFGSVFVFFLCSCGIKASTQPLQPPIVEIKRLGEFVYLRSLEGEVIPKGFERKEVGWVKKSAQGFCFKVKRVEGKSSNQCVGGLLEQEPVVKIDYHGDKAKVSFEGFDSYELYFSLENPWSGKKTSQSVELERDYVEKCYFVVGKKGKDYSKPVKFCLEPLPHPPIKEVERLEYRIVGDSVYLLWSYEPDRFFKEFVIFEGDKEIGTTTGYTFELRKKDKQTIYRVKVRSIYGKESKGVEILYNP